VPTKVGEILTDILDAIRNTEAFAAVTLGPDNDAARWPRAEVVPITIEHLQPEDAPEGQWCALSAQVYIHVRSTEKASGLERALSLAGTAQAAVLTDRFRTHRCRDLPIGKATELGPAKFKPEVRSPYLAVAFEVRCHFEFQGEE
jgi:hypothetical protein